MPVTTFKYKVALLFLGLLAGIILLELGLRTAGFIVFYLQERENRQALRQRSEYVILCLGESTTAIGGDDSYPKQLERILNERNPGGKVAVVNKGIVGSNTTAIIARLPEYLAEYHPNMVIAMMGINEGPGVADPAGGATPITVGFFRNLRVYKLFRLLWDRISYNVELARTSRRINKEAEDILTLAETAITVTGAQKQQSPLNIPEDAVNNLEKGDRHFERDEFEDALPFYRAAFQADPGNTAIITRLARCLREMQSFQEDREMLRRLLLIDPLNPDVYVELGNSFRDQQAWETAEMFYRRAIALNPDLARAYLEWGHVYKRQGDSKNAIALYLKALELDPDNASISMQLVYLARYYDTLGNYEEAEKLFKKALEREPDYADGYAQLGRFYDWRGRNREAELMCQRAIEIDPANELAYAELGDIYKSRGLTEEAGRMYRKALDINPLNNIAFRVLAVWYLEEGKYGEVEDLCEKIIENNPRHDVALGIMAVSCQAQGKIDLAEKYFSQAKELRAGLLNPNVAKNYQKAAQMVRERGIPLVCVQYPMRNVDDLKRMFPDPEGIIFVDNEAVFKLALEAGSYGDLFTDCFAGDFGHCTPLGNRLLAGNIADSIFPAIRPKTIQPEKD